MNLQLSSIESQLLRSNVALKRAWISQIEKDLGTAFSELDEESSWEDVCGELQRYLAAEFEHSEGQIPEMLYRIDIPEKGMHIEMQSGKWEDWFVLLAHAVAFREAQKVIFRFQYSGKL